MIAIHSYSEILRTLVIASRYTAGGEKVTVFVCANDDLAQLMEHVNTHSFANSLRVIRFSPPKRGRTGSRAIGSLQRAFATARALRRVRQRYVHLAEGADAYFFTVYASPAVFALVSSLGGGGNAHLIHVYDLPMAKRGRGLRLAVLARLLELKLVYGRRLTLRRYAGKLYEHLPRSAVGRLSPRVTNASDAERWLAEEEVDRFNSFLPQRYSAIYFDQPLVRSGRVTIAEYTRVIDALFDILRRHFGVDAIGIKYHPGMASDRVARGGCEIPRFIPAEFLYDDSVRIYVSFSSGAIANLDSGVAVSLLDLITFRDEGAKAVIRRRLKAACRTPVHFPQTFEDLEQLVRAAKRGVPQAAAVATGA